MVPLALPARSLDWGSTRDTLYLKSLEFPCDASSCDDMRVWTNPAEWPGDVIVMAKIDGPFAVGAKITTRVTGHPPLTSTVTRIESPMLWTGVARAPGLTETIDHLIEPTDSGTLITERTVLTGPLASIAARILGEECGRL
jgi:hypothetical protein